MKTVGKQLQDARVTKGWSPELAARETKIRVDRLNELEADDYSNFSSPTYARGFVRTYARSLGLDEYKILRQLDNKLPEDDNASFVNDTGVPYMPEPSKVSKPFEVGRGVYIAAGIGAAVLLLIGFILVQAYRADYFTQAIPATIPNATTNSAPLVPDSESTARALPADSNAPPVALPVDATAIAATPAGTNTAPTVPAAAAPVATAPADTNAAPRALPVDLNALAASSNAAPTAPVAPAVVAPGVIAAPPAAITRAPAANANAVAATPTTAPAPGAAVIIASPTPNNVPVVAETSAAPTTPLNTTTSPRAQAVDLNALAATVPAGNTVAAAATPAPQSTPTPHASPALSARQSNSRLQAPVVAVNKSPSMSTAVPVAAPVAAAPVNMPIAASVAPAQEFRPSPDLAAAQTPPTDAAPTPASFAPVAAPENRMTPTTAIRAAPDSASALTGGDSMATTEVAQKRPAEKSRVKRLVLTASRDSFVRVVALDGPNGDKVRYSSMLHSGESISFSDRKYSINVGDPAAVDIALDGINYGPHSDHSEPDTFTVESHQP